MNEHLSPSVLNALADGELSTEELVNANQHLAGCQSCTANALYQSMLKSSTAKAGMRYTPSPRLQNRLGRQRGGFWSPGWVVAAAVLLVSASLIFVQRTTRTAEVASAENSALVTEVFDQHLATIAGNLPPQVLSSDRHTVKPWFQGKLPFSFNLPESLPAGTTLDGANLTYLHNRPVAQLLYSIGKHRVSVFVRERRGPAGPALTIAHSGFQVMGFETNDLDVTAVSDVEAARLGELVSAIRGGQRGG
jgi:anti-sigma factor RsiW